MKAYFFEARGHTMHFVEHVRTCLKTCKIANKPGDAMSGHGGTCRKSNMYQLS